MTSRESSLPTMAEALTLLTAAAVLAFAVLRRGRGEILDQTFVHVLIVFASACIAAGTVWMKCRARLTQPLRGDENDRGKGLPQPSIRRNAMVREGGADPDGIAMGSVLVPLLFSASSCLSHSMQITDCEGSAQDDEAGGRSPLVVDIYAQIAAVSGFAFSVASLLHSVLQRAQQSRDKFYRSSWIWRFMSVEGSMEIVTALLYLLTTFLWNLIEYTRRSGNINAENSRKSPPFVIAPMVCVVQCISFAWYCRPVLRSWAKVSNLDSCPARMASKVCGGNAGVKASHSIKEKATSIDDCEAFSGLNSVFSRGEWMAVSSILSIICVDFGVRYYGSSKNRLLPMPPHLAVAHGGLIGCILGCAISSFISCNHQRRNHHISLVKKGSGMMVPICLAKFCLVVASTIAFVELALSRSCAYHEKMCPAAGAKISSNLLRYVPSSLTWLGAFLLLPEQPSHPCSWLRWAGVDTQPRWVWLVYWSAIMASLAPFAIIFAVKLKQMKGTPEKRRYTVVARKFFHFVAVILFLPPTFLAPSMMTLSYAVASALLTLVETLRVTIASSDSHWEKTETNKELTQSNTSQDRFTVNSFYEAFFDEKDAGGKEGGFVVTHTALICGCAAPLWLKEVLFQHTVGFLVDNPPTAASVEYMEEELVLMILFPVVGIVVLGVGDSAGALVGIFFGKTQWPGSRRTIEGSAAMLFSMFTFAVLLCWDSWAFPSFNASKLFFLLVALTALEASTLQIDNICLPIAGAAFIMIELILT